MNQSSSSSLNYYETIAYLYRWNHLHHDQIIAALQATCRLVTNEKRIRVPDHVVNILDQSIQQLLSLPAYITNISATIHNSSEHIKILQSILLRLERIRWFSDTLNTDPYISMDMYIQAIHQIAIYLPIWAPMILPLCIAFLQSCWRYFIGKKKPKNPPSSSTVSNSITNIPMSSNLPSNTSTNISSKTRSANPITTAGNSVLSPEDHEKILIYMIDQLQQRQLQSSSTAYYQESDYGVAKICQGKGTLFIRPYDHNMQDGLDNYDGPGVRSLYAAGQAAHTITHTASSIHLPWLRTVVYGDMRNVRASYQEDILSNKHQSRTKQYWIATMDKDEFMTCFSVPKEIMDTAYQYYLDIVNHEEQKTTTIVLPKQEVDTKMLVSYGEKYIDNDNYFSRLRTLVKTCMTTANSKFSPPSTEEVQALAGLRTGSIHFDRFGRIIIGTVAIVPFVPDEEGDDKIILQALHTLPENKLDINLTVENIGELKRMSITPLARRSGIAKILVYHAEHWTYHNTNYKSIYLSTLKTMIGAPALYLSSKYNDITRKAWLTGYNFATGSGISTKSTSTEGDSTEENKETVQDIDILPPSVIMFVAEFGKILQKSNYIQE